MAWLKALTVAEGILSGRMRMHSMKTVPGSPPRVSLNRASSRQMTPRDAQMTRLPV